MIARIGARLRNLGRVRGVLARAGIVLFVCVLAYLVVLPLVRLQINAFENGAAGYRFAYGSPRLADVLHTTVVLAVGSVVFAVLLGTALAWAASRLPRRWGMLQVLPVLPIVIPFVANVIGWGFLFSPGPGYGNAVLRLLPWWSDLRTGPVDVYTLPWIVIVTGFALTSFVYLFVTAGLRNLNQEYPEAAEVCGSSSAGAFFKVTLPLMRPSLIYGSGVVLLLGLGQFTAPLLLGTNPGVRVLTTEMFSYASEGTALGFAAAAALGSPLVVFGLVVVVLQRIGLGDQRRFVTHSGRSFVPSDRTSRAAVAGIVIYFLVSSVLPITALVLVAVSPFWSGTLEPNEFTLEHLRTVLSGSDTSDAIRTSVTTASLAVLVAIVIGLAAASLILRGQHLAPVRSLLDFIVSIPLGVPAVIFGVGFLLAYSYPPLILYGTDWVIILVYVTLMLPFATRMLLAGMVSIGESYLEASRASGASVLMTNVRILLPLLRTTIGGAAALMFVLLTHEFSASMLVRTPTTQVMGTVLFEYWANGSYPTVAAIALVMTVVTAIGVALAMQLGGRDIFSRL